MHFGHLHTSALQMQLVSGHGHSSAQISQIVGWSLLNISFISSLYRRARFLFRIRHTAENAAVLAALRFARGTWFFVGQWLYVVMVSGAIALHLSHIQYDSYRLLALDRQSGVSQATSGTGACRIAYSRVPAFSARLNCLSCSW